MDCRQSLPRLFGVKLDPQKLAEMKQQLESYTYKVYPNSTVNLITDSSGVINVDITMGHTYNTGSVTSVTYNGYGGTGGYGTITASPYLDSNIINAEKENLRKQRLKTMMEESKF